MAPMPGRLLEVRAVASLNIKGQGSRKMVADVGTVETDSRAHRALAVL
jgi:hypothetical protein